MHSTMRINRLAQFASKTVMMSNPLLKFQFSNAASVAQGNFKAFRSEYETNVNAFKDKIAQIERENAKSNPKPTNTQYNHPYDSPHHKLNFSPVKTAELFHDFIGPEQVSPHYENFLMSRKYLMIFWVGFFIINMGAASIDLNWMMRSSLVPWIFWFQLMYWYLEGRKSLLKPMLVRFYRRAAAQECYQFEVYYHENIENKIRELQRFAKSQLEYFDIHSSYNEIKAESVNNFLANEYFSLQNHIKSRALNILQSAEKQEEINRVKYLQNVIDGAIAELDTAMTGSNKDLVLDALFDSAVDGISKNYCDYANDPLLPLVRAKIRQSVADHANLSEEEQSKIISLTDSQFAVIKSADVRAQKEYLEEIPKNFDGGLKNQDSVARILNNWGK